MEELEAREYTSIVLQNISQTITEVLSKNLQDYIDFEDNEQEADFVLSLMDIRRKANELNRKLSRKTGQL